MKVLVHTKTGKRLAYYPSHFSTTAEARKWWMQVLRRPNFDIDAVSFGRFAICCSEIDFVEIQGGE